MPTLYFISGPRGANATRSPALHARIVAMPIAAVTRLRLRKRRFAPLLLWSALRSLRQSRLADGCLAADVRTTRARAFWTRTLWRDAGAMRAYMRSGAHRLAMRKLPHWC